MREITSKYANMTMKSIWPAAIRLAPAMRVVAIPKRRIAYAVFTSTPLTSSPFAHSRSAASIVAFSAAR